MFHEAETWVAIAFLVFVALLAELEEAKKLKDEAAALLAQYQKKRQDAETEAQSIITGAKAEAERLSAEAKVKAEEFVARRTKMAEQKIAQAEAQAVADVRAAAADAAVAAAEKILAEQAKGDVANQLIAKGVEDVRNKLN
jgi:F-type H+-transporting ATPase subunit b